MAIVPGRLSEATIAREQPDGVHRPMRSRISPTPRQPRRAQRAHPRNARSSLLARPTLRTPSAASAGGRLGPGLEFVGWTSLVAPIDHLIAAAQPGLARTPTKGWNHDRSLPPVPHRGGVDRRRHTVDHRFARRRAVPHRLQAGVPSSSSAAAVPAYAAKLQPELEQLAKDMLVERSGDRGPFARARRLDDDVVPRWMSAGSTSDPGRTSPVVC